MNTRDHIVRSYDKELGTLGRLVMRMGGLVENQLLAALNALTTYDQNGAGLVVERDSLIDDLEVQTDETAFRILALRHPIADDLRYVIGVIKIAGHLERAGDHAKNFAKRVREASERPDPALCEGIYRLGKLVSSMMTDVMDAFANKDAARAIGVWNRDEEVDDLHSAILRDVVTHMAKEPDNLTNTSHLLFMVRNLERIGDFATNIAEAIRFQHQGVMTTEERPKSNDVALGD